jgi:hypothetical protein
MTKQMNLMKLITGGDELMNHCNSCQFAQATLLSLER